MGGLKNLDFGAKLGGFNVLNCPDHVLVSTMQFWNEYNIPFLDQAIARGDIITLATNPMKDLSKVFDISKTQVPNVNNFDELLQMLKNYDYDDLKGFGKELKYLSTKEGVNIIN